MAQLQAIREAGEQESMARCALFASFLLLSLSLPTVLSISDGPSPIDPLIGRTLECCFPPPLSLSSPSLYAYESQLMCCPSCSSSSK